MRWLARHLPDLPEVDSENIQEARKAQKKSAEDLVSAVMYRRDVGTEVANIQRVLLRNHLAPSFEAAYRRRA